MPSETATTSSPTSSTLARGIYWSLSAFFLAWAIHANGGRYNPVGMLWLTVAIVTALLGVYKPVLPFEASTRALNTILAGCVSGFAALMMVPTSSSLGPIFFLGGWAVCGAVAWLLSRIVKGNAARVLFPLLVIINGVMWMGAVQKAHQDEANPRRFVFHVRNDVQYFAEQAAEELTHFRNPYTIRMKNVMGADLPFYPANATDKDGRLPFGYPYMPLSLLVSLPGYWLGDIRFANVFLVLGTALLLAYARPSTTSQLAASLFLLLPSSLFVLLMSWTEPVAVFFAAVTLFCAFRAPKWLWLALGCLVASKQYTVFLLQLLPLLFPEKALWKRLLWQSLTVAAVLTLPMALWDIDGFYRSVVQMQFKQPFREDSLSYFITILRAGGPYLSPLIGFLALVGGLVFGLLKAPRSAAGWCSAGAVAFLGFFALNKQAFANYYFWVFGLLVAAIAVALPGREEIGP